jgi:benzoate membrane transport protein
MSAEAVPAKDNWVTITTAALAAVVVGFASTILIVMQAGQAIGANPAQQASMAAILCFGMAATSLFLSWQHRMPIITAWSTPGAALIASSNAHVGYQDALGAFAVAGLLMAAAALIKPLAQAIARIPAPIASAMLGGVLLHYALGIPQAALVMPAFVLPLVALFFLLRLWLPLYAVPAVTVAGVMLAAFSGDFGSACCALAVTPLTFDAPSFTATAILGLGVPLFLVTMASQNLPGFAVLRANGYEPPVTSALLTTGLASAVMAPFGSHAINMAAITASLAAGPDAHPDRSRRWLVALPYFVLYTGVGLAAALFVGVLGALPKALITAVAGLALFSPIVGAVTAMVKEPRDLDSALVTFLVTASGVTIAGVGAAFWGLVAGLLLHAARHFAAKA